MEVIEGKVVGGELHGDSFRVVFGRKTDSLKLYINGKLVSGLDSMVIYASGLSSEVSIRFRLDESYVKYRRKDERLQGSKEPKRRLRNGN